MKTLALISSFVGYIWIVIVYIAIINGLVKMDTNTYWIGPILLVPGALLIVLSQLAKRNGARKEINLLIADLLLSEGDTNNVQAAVIKIVKKYRLRKTGIKKVISAIAHRLTRKEPQLERGGDVEETVLNILKSMSSHDTDNKPHSDITGMKEGKVESQKKSLIKKTTQKTDKLPSDVSEMKEGKVKTQKELLIERTVRDKGKYHSYHSDVVNDEALVVQGQPPSMIENQLTNRIQTTTNLKSLENLFEGVAKFKFIGQTGSVLEKVVNIMNKTKTLARGWVWKAVNTIFPPIVIIDASIGKIHSLLQEVALPINTLHQKLPNILENIKSLEGGHSRSPEFSGQLYSVVSVLPDVESHLSRLNTITNDTYEATGSFNLAYEKVKLIKGIGKLATTLNENLLKAHEYLGSLLENNERLVSATRDALLWLPDYQEQNRQIVPSSELCQAVFSRGFFKKEVCNRQVSWFDDEAESVCNKCGIYLCEDHRDFVSQPSGSPIRVLWYCSRCKKKLKDSD